MRCSVTHCISEHTLVDLLKSLITDSVALDICSCNVTNSSIELNGELQTEEIHVNWLHMSGHGGPINWFNKTCMLLSYFSRSCIYLRGVRCQGSEFCRYVTTVSIRSEPKTLNSVEYGRFELFVLYWSTCIFFSRSIVGKVHELYGINFILFMKFSISIRAVRGFFNMKMRMSSEKYILVFAP